MRFGVYLKKKTDFTKRVWEKYGFFLFISRVFPGKQTWKQSKAIALIIPHLQVVTDMAIDKFSNYILS